MKLFGALFLLCGAPIVAAAQTHAAVPEPAKGQEQAAAPAAASKAAIDPAKEAAIRKLFEVQGTKDAMRQVIAGMSANMKPLLESSLPPGEYRAQLIDLFLQKFQSKLSVDQLLELAIPVYDKHFSVDEIEGLAKFYQTPLGKKAISVLPQVLLESQAAGQKVGEQLGRDAMTEVLNEHPDLKKALQDASTAPKN